jgi:heme/copper-type cytochrome/quinol oxidase subunit 3
MAGSAVQPASGGIALAGSNTAVSVDSPEAVLASLATGERRVGNAMVVGSRAAFAAGMMFLAAVAGGYVSVRNRALEGGVRSEETGKLPTFFTSDMKFNNYGAVTTMLSVVFASLAIEYAIVALKAGQKKWATGAHALAVLTNIAGINLAWGLGRNMGFGVADSSYAVLVLALIAVAIGFMLVALVATVISWSRIIVGQATAVQPLHVRNASWFVHLGTVAWCVAWATIYLYK